MAINRPIIQVPFNFEPRNYQLEFMKALDNGIRKACLVWHRRAGKDKACWVYLIGRAFRKPGNYYYVFPEETAARRALWHNVDSDGFKALDHIPKEIIQGEIRNQTMELTLTNGSTIKLLGTTDPDKVRGISGQGFVLSEYAYQDPYFYNAVVVPVIRESGGWVIVNSTPNGRNHFYQLASAAKDSKDWYYSEMQTLWPEKPNYSGLVTPEQIKEDQATSGLTDADVEQEYGVSFHVGTKGTYYADEVDKAVADGRVGNFPVDDHKWVDTFWDLGVDDNTVIWFRQLDGSRQIWVDYYENSGKGLAHYVQVLRDLGYKYKTHYLPHDGKHHSVQTGQTTAEFFRQLCTSAGISDDVVPCTRAQNVQQEIFKVRGAFCKYWFNKDLTKDGLTHLMNYSRKFDRKKNVFAKNPDHTAASHAADAIRQSVAPEVTSDESYQFTRQQFKIIGLDDYDPFR